MRTLALATALLLAGCGGMNIDASGSEVYRIFPPGDPGVRDMPPAVNVAVFALDKGRMAYCLIQPRGYPERCLIVPRDVSHASCVLNTRMLTMTCEGGI